jgi:hypothetical protein
MGRPGILIRDTEWFPCRRQWSASGAVVVVVIEGFFLNWKNTITTTITTLNTMWLSGVVYAGTTDR